MGNNHKVKISCVIGLPYGKYAHMKTLRDYLDSLPRGGVKAFAEKLGIKESYLCRLASGDRKITARWALLISKASNNELLPKHLMPELFEDSLNP